MEKRNVRIKGALKETVIKKRNEETRQLVTIRLMLCSCLHYATV